MKILLIHQVFLLPGQGGGTRHFEFGRFCAKAGHEFHAVASDVSYYDGTRDRNVVSHEVIEGVHIHRARMSGSIHRSFLWRMVGYLTFMISSTWTAWRVGRVDVVMGTSPPLFQGVSAWLVAVLRHRPLLLEIRDLWPDFAIDMGILRNPLLIRLARWLENFLYRRATHILVNSPSYRQHLIEHGVPAQKISVIANGVDPQMFDPDADGEAFRDELRLHGKFVITYAGAIGPANDIPTLIRTAERLSGRERIHFLIVGDGKARHTVERMIAERKLTNVTLTGIRPKLQIKNILAMSDACVATLMDIPMFRMPYPNKVFDYMAAGRPTVLGIDGAIRDVIEKANGGLFVKPGDDAALAEAVAYLADHPEIAAKMGRDARTYVCEHFDRAKHSDQFIELMSAMACRDMPPRYDV